MVRRSLAEALNAEALQFLEDGKPKSTSAAAAEPAERSAKPGFDRVFDLDMFTAEDRALLRRQFQMNYAAALEAAGVGVTREGLEEPPRSHVPTTRGLDKDLRTLRREVALLSDLNRQLLRVIGLLSGCRSEELRDFLLGRLTAQQPAPTPPPPPAPSDGGTTEAATTERDGEEAAPQEAAPQPAATNGHAERGPAEEPAVAEEEVEATQSAPPSRPAPTRIELPRSPYAPAAATHRRVRPDETSRRTLPVRDRRSPPATGGTSAAGTKICPRCSRELPGDARRCLFCGRAFVVRA